jgi:hypothetical protein
MTAGLPGLYCFRKKPWLRFVMVLIFASNTENMIKRKCYCLLKAYRWRRITSRLYKEDNLRIVLGKEVA